MEAYAARLALVIHETRVASNDLSVIDQYTVDEQSMQAGIALIGWFKNETKRIYAYLHGNECDRQWQKVEEFIRQHGGTVTARDLGRGPYRSHRKADMEAELQTFIDNGWLERASPAPGPTGGHPKCIYRLTDL